MATLKKVHIVHISTPKPTLIKRSGLPQNQDKLKFNIEVFPYNKKSFYVKVRRQSFVLDYSKEDVLVISADTHFEVWTTNNKLFIEPLSNTGIDLIAQLFITSVAHCRLYQIEIGSKDAMHNIGVY